MSWINTTTPPDGTRTTFTFANPPSWVTWNGLTLFATLGYVTTDSTGLTVRFIDATGATLTPDSSDVIRGWIDAAVGVRLSTLLDPMLRMAGITVLPGTTPNTDQYGEVVPMVNRMLESWSIDRAKIFTSKIEQFPLVSGQKQYSIGPGGDFDTARPAFIKIANAILPTSPVIRWPIEILDDYDWGAIAIQDIPGAPPYQLYFDGSYDSNGRANIYLRFQPPADYELELYTWQALQSGFSSPSDLAVFPPGYADAIVMNGALRVAQLNPLESKLNGMQMQSLRTTARNALDAIQNLNRSCPTIGSEAGIGDDMTDASRIGRGWLDGNIR